MSTRNLEALLAPKRVAVIGAGRENNQLGHLVLRNLVDGGYEGVVYPVNPHAEAVSGIQAYPRVGDLPSAPDLALVCTSAAAVPAIVNECGECGVRSIAVLSAGFRESGEEGRELEQAISSQLEIHKDLRLLGPNCLGLIVPRIGLNASFARTMPRDGNIALISQSGALATSIIDWAVGAGVGFSHVVSVGNMLDVDLGDLIDYLGIDARTRSIILYVEGVTNARKFVSASRAFTRSKPIVVYKAGRFAATGRATTSHTGAMAGEDAVFEVAARRAGLVRVERIEDIFSTAELLARARPVSEARLAIVTNAGGPGVMAADALLSRGGNLAELDQRTLDILDAALPGAWSHGNPVDVLGDASAERYGHAVDALLRSPAVDALLVVLTPQAMTDASAAAASVLAARADSAKPVVAAWMGGPAVAGGIERLRAGGVAAYSYPEQAVSALMDLVTYARNRQLLHETPRTIPVAFSVDRGRAKELMAAILSEGPAELSELSTKSLLDAYDIPITRPTPVASEDEAIAMADRIGYPVVMKIRSPDITHKTDVGGVEIGLGDGDAVRDACRRILSSVARLRPEATVHGVTIQPMARFTGHELVLGAKKDATFGAVVLLGMGGVTTEVFGDRAIELPPLNERLAMRMLQSLKIWPLLAGHRGSPRVDIDALLEVVSRFSYLVADYPELTDIEINPLLVGPAGVVALDARASVDESLLVSPAAPYSHLAIRPYPDELVRDVVLSSGLEVRLRPIRPEDEPAWHEMLDACSPESIGERFHAMIRHTHEFATRYCFIDYDRELAIVVELPKEGVLAGVGRLVADADRRSAEYAVLVADPWQRQGLGMLVTEYCLELARSWGVQRVFATTTPSNAGMIEVLRRGGFDVASREGSVVGEWRPEAVGVSIP